MKRLYHYLFVGFVSLITVILAAFLLLFTDVAFSSVGTADTHLSNGNIWSVNKLRLSAELAYYNYLSSTSNEKSLTLDNTTISQQNIVDKQREAYNFLSNKDTTSTQETETVSTNVQHHNVRISKLHSRHGKRGKKSKYHFNDSNTTTLSNLSTANSTPRVVNHVRTVTEKLEYNNKIGLQLDVDRGASEKVEGSIEAVDMNETYTEEDDHYNEEYYTSKDEMIVSEAERIRRALILSQNEEFEAIDNNSHTVITGASNITQKSHGSLLHGGSYIKPELMKRSTNTQFHMPCPCVYRSINEIVTAIWMKPLLRILSSFQGNQVTLVIANDAYRDVLLNWLISALIMSHPPIDNILVVCLDTKLYNLLQSRDIPSILAPFSSVLNTKHHFRRYFELIMMMRLGFMCIINRLGYDCAMYDIDAIILKNPQPLYDKWDSMDIVGSRGELPRELWRRWGVSICIGAVFIRSNARTENYWEAVYLSKVKGSGMANDQIRLNYGLHKMDIKWEKSGQENKKHDVPAVGHCSSSEVSVVVLPFSQICRFGCRVDLRNDYYIWHKGGNRDKTSKMKGAKQGHTWFLKERWNELHSNMIVDVKGTIWLKRISMHT